MRAADWRTFWRTFLLLSPLAIVVGFVAGELSLPSPAPDYSQVRETPPSATPSETPPPESPPLAPSEVPDTPSVIPVPPMVDPGESPIPMFTTPP